MLSGWRVFEHDAAYRIEPRNAKPVPEARQLRADALPGQRREHGGRRVSVPLGDGSRDGLRDAGGHAGLLHQSREDGVNRGRRGRHHACRSAERAVL